MTGPARTAGVVGGVGDPGDALEAPLREADLAPPEWLPRLEAEEDEKWAPLPAPPAPLAGVADDVEERDSSGRARWEDTPAKAFSRARCFPREEALLLR